MVKSTTKSVFIYSSIILALALFAYLVLASLPSAVLNSPVTGGNYTTSLNFTCTIANVVFPEVRSFNVSMYANSSGGQTGRLDPQKVSLSATTVISNTTNASQSLFYNTTVLIRNLTGSALSDSKFYNITCYANVNVTDFFSSSITNITVDNTPPRVMNITINRVNGTLNYTRYCNVTCNNTALDNAAGVGLVNNLKWVNLTGSYNLEIRANDTTIGIGYGNAGAAGGSIVYMNFTKDTNSTLIPLYYNATNLVYNATLNTATLADGKYNVTFFANDSLGNTNTTESVELSIDNNGPVLTHTCSPATTTITQGDTLTCSCSAVDAGSSVNGTTTFTVNPSTTTAGTQSTTCTAKDYLGHQSNSTYSFTVNEASSGGSSTGGSSGTTSYSTTYVPSTDVLASGYTKELATTERIKMTVGTADHSITVSGLTATSATISVSSTPQTATINIGDIKKFDLNADNYYDVSVKLNSISNNKASLTVTSIHESTATTPSVVPNPNPVTPPTPTTPTTTKLGVWTWVIIIVVVLVVIIAAWMILRKKQ